MNIKGTPRDKRDTAATLCKIIRDKRALLEQNSPQSTSLSKLLEMSEINFEENWRYRTLSKLETLFHVTNVITVLNASVVSDRVSR